MKDRLPLRAPSSYGDDGEGFHVLSRHPEAGSGCPQCIFDVSRSIITQRARLVGFPAEAFGAGEIDSCTRNEAERRGTAGPVESPHIRVRTNRSQLIPSRDRMFDTVSIVLVGKYTSLQDSYMSVVKALEHASMRCDRKLELHVSSSDVIVHIPVGRFIRS